MNSDILHLFKELKKLDANLYLEEGTLKLNVKKGLLTQEIADTIKSNKDEIITLLSERNNKDYFEIEATARKNAYPVSPAQYRLWVLSQFEGSSAAYNMPHSVKLEGDYDISNFKKAIWSVIERHEILRTVFRENSEGVLEQLIIKRADLDFDIDYKDFREKEDPEKYTREYMNKDSYISFDLENGPLIRVCLLQLTDKEYIFYYNMHHIISDRWSINILSRDIISYYKHFIEGTTLELPELRIQYKDYTIWQLNQLENEVYTGYKKYWLDKLSGDLPVLDLPNYKKRPGLKTFSGRHLTVWLNKEDTRYIRTFIKEKGGTLFMFLLSSLKVLFHRYTGQEDIVIGTPVAGRDHSDLENQIGFYLNTLALRSTIHGDMSFDRFFEKVKQDLLEVYSNQMYPIDRVIEELNLNRDTGRNPLFDIVLVLQNTGRIADKLDSIDIDTDVIEDKGEIKAKFDIEFNFEEVGDHLRLILTYNTDVYDYEMITGLLKHYKEIVRKTVKDSDLPISKIQYLSESEKNALLYKYNDTIVDYSKDKTWIDFFEEQVLKTPDNIALKQNEETLTYKELNDRTNAIANDLINRGIVPETNVGVLFNRGFEMVVALLGILKSGGSYVPIDPEYPVERQCYIAQNSKVSFVLSDDSGKSLGEKLSDIEFIGLPSITDKNVSLQNPEVQIACDQLAYTIYTSGSTGNPKGVMIEHFSLINLIRWVNETFAVNEKDKLLFITSVCFDLSVYDIFGMLVSGGSIYIATKDDFPNLEKIIVSEKITFWDSVPTTFNYLVDKLSADHKDYINNSLRLVFMSGDWIPVSLPDRAKQFFPNAEIISLGGATEGTIWSNYYPINKVEAGWNSIPYGKPITNNFFYILDDNLEPVPIGVTGELFIGGVGVARGYDNDSIKTNAAFVKDPFNDRLGGRMYKTGDSGRWMPNGNMQFIGRKDNQVKIRGFRVELGEIESVLSKYSGLKDCIVDIVKDQDNQNQLCAYLVKNESYDKDELKTYLQAKMPNYMIPSYYVYMEDLPLNSNGKIDRKKLPKPDNTHKEEINYVAPTTVLQKTIAKVWMQLLKAEKISIRDNFYDLGGDSLKAIRLINEYHKIFNVKLSITTIFLHATLESHVTVITEAKKEKHTLIPKVSKQTNYAISDSQRKLWLISQLEGGSEVYNMPYSIKLEGNYNIQNFKRAIKSVIERHEILRTVFQEDSNGEIRQTILELSELGFDFDYEDYCLEENPKICALKYIEEDSYKPFDLQNGPLLRVSLLHTSNSDYILYYNMHHIISDGWSMDILSRDILEYYNYYNEGVKLDLPDLRIQYKDYAAWQLSQLKTENYETHKEYWLNKLRGDVPVLNLSTHKQRQALKTYKGKLLSTYLNKKDTNEIQKYVQDKGGTLFMFLLSSFKVLLYRYTGQEDIVLSSPIAVREHSDLKNQIGFYINTLPLRSNVKATISFDKFYQQIKQDLLESYTHQMYPFDRMIEELEQEEGINKNDLFGIRVVLQNTGDGEKKPVISEDKIGVIKDYGTTKAKFDILLVFEEVGDHIKIGLTYNTDVYDNKLITGLINHYQLLIKEILQESNTKIKNLDYLRNSEQSKFVYQSSKKLLDSNDKTIIDLFKEQVIKNPNSKAIVFEDHELTYQELDERSTNLAHYLTERYDIKSNDLIGLLMPTSDWSILSILAILKTGAAYVPIDPELPIKRMQYLINNANLKTLVIQSEDQEKLSNCEADLFVVNNIWEEIKNNKTRSDLPATTLGTVAYVIYTSGSTGKPKGVLITHDNLMDYVLGLFENTNIRSSKVFALMSNIATDLGNTVIYGALLSGGTLHLLQKETLRNAEEVHKYFDKNEIDCIKIVPNHWKALTNGDHCLLPNRMIVFGGDKLSVDIVQRINQQNSNVTILNHYGPTETTIGKLLFHTSTNDSYSSIPIGKPFSETSIYVVDKHLNICPIGIPGELLIGGKGVAKGYLNNPELTQQQFIQNPFTEERETLYRTGDLVRMLEDGNIEFIGRIDNQVKIRGNRVELGAIENSLFSNEKIDEALVLARELNAEDKELVAYYRGSGSIGSSVLRAYMGDRLPSYMVPAYFVFMKEFPLTANGKIDKKVLPDPTIELSEEKQYLEPKNEKEKILVEIWESVLKRQNIGINDNFYDLGGDSIKSILIVSRLKQSGYGLKVAQLMKAPVISKLAPDLTQIEQVVNQSSVNGKVSLLPIQSYFLSSDLLKNKSHYNQSVILERAASIDFSLMNKSLELLVKHHDALRMIYTNEKGIWSQENKAETYKGYSLDLHDLSDSDKYQSEISALCDALQSSINIEKGPLVKAALFKLKTKDCFVLIIHHLVVDGVSWRILLEDLYNIYESLEQQTKISLPQKTDSYQRWASLLKEYASGKTLNQEKTYWNNILSEEVFPIYKETESIDLSKGKIKSAYFSLGQETVELLQTRTHRVYNTEINDVLLAALGISIQKVFKKNRTIVDLEGHGREGIIDGVDVTRTVGWFTSLYPFVLDVGNEFLDYSTALIQVKEALRKLPNKGIGYGILRYLNNELDKEVITSILFNFLGDFGNVSKEEGDDSRKSFVHSKEYKGAESSKENDNLGKRLRVSGMLVNGILEMNISYNDSVYEGKYISDLAQTYQSVLKEMVQQLSQLTETYLTPSDLTYKELTVSELSELSGNNNIEDVYQLSPLQEGLFYHWISGNDKTTYCTQRSYRLRMPKINLDNVQKSYELLVKRHSVLRTGFTTRYGKLLQIVSENFIDTYRFKDLSSIMSKEDQELQVSYYKEKDRIQGFEIEQNSLIRLGIISLGDGDYEFVWSYHHILMDGWCGSILINEFYQILVSLEKDIEVSLPEVTPYSTYLKWLDKIDRQSSLSYWNKYLQDYSNKAILPFERINTTSEEHLAKEERVTINSKILEKLRSLCSQLKITENIFIQCAWGYLLSKYNNTQDVVFGSVVSGRPGEIPGVEQMIGLFINTIPVRIRYSEDTTIMDLLSKQQKDSIESIDHHYLNLSDVQTESILGMDLLDHVFVFENYAINQLDTNFIGLNKEEEISLLASQNINETHYDFDILVAPEKETVVVSFRYNGNVYNDKDIQQLRNHFENVISIFLEDQKTLLKDISYLSEKEKNELLYDFNNTVVDYPKKTTFIDFFENQVIKTPGNIALRQHEKTISYKELNNRANLIAVNLIKRGITPETKIGVLFDRSFEMVITLLGILKAGGSYVPIDPEYPIERQRYIAQNSEVSIILSDKSASELTHELPNVEFIQISDFNFEDEIISNPNVKIAWNQLAYTIYTSGSTGNPKGVMIEHYSLINLIRWVNETFSIDENDRLLCVTSVCFDLSVYDIFGILASGGSVFIATKNDLHDFSVLQNILTNEKITFWDSVPTTFNYLVDELSFHKTDCISSSLRLVFLSGDWIPVSLPDRAKQYFPNAKIISLGGATEGTIWSNYYPINEVGSNWKSIPYGKPITNNFFYVLDENLNPVPKGIPGELCIGGVGVARGYDNDTQKTNASFIKNPFNDSLGGRMYKTGDLGRWMTNGQMEFIGRKDNQVKIRGFRVELGEIESVLSKNEGVKEGIVNVIKDGDNQNQLCAYIVENDTYDLEKVKNHLKANLPNYMVPAYFVTLMSLPLNSNGKIDRKRLPYPSHSEDQDKHFIAPVSEMQKAIAIIWSRILKIEKIGLDDKFFDLGGHSLNAVRLISEYHKAFDVRLTIQDVFSDITLESHEALISASEKNEHMVIPEIPYASKYPISNAQRRLWILSLFEGGSTAYNMPNFVHLDGDYDINNFKRSIWSVIERHEILRTVFQKDSQDNVNQIVLEKNEINFKIGYQDYRLQNAPLEYAMSFIKKDAYNSFDLENGPLIRVSLLQLSDSKYIFYYNMHHIISDGWSMNILSRDVLAYYNHYQDGIPLEIPELRIQYKEYSVWQLTQLETDRYQTHRKYWLDKLSGNIPIIDLPSTKQRPILITNSGQRLSTYLDKAVTTSIRNYVAEKGGTLFMSLVASLKVLFYRYTDQKDIIVGIPVAGREHADLKDQIGFYVNTLALRSTIADHSSFDKFYASVKQDLLDAYTHQTYPFDQLIEELDLSKNTSRNALFDVMVDMKFSNEVGNSQDISPNKINAIKNEGGGVAKFDLEFTFIEVGDNLKLEVVYNTGVYDHDMVSGLMHHYQQLISRLVVGNNIAIGEVNYLSELEEQKLLYDFNNTKVSYPKNKTIVDLFEEQVIKNANNTAIIFENVELTYLELNEYSNQLAYYIQHEYAITSDDLIGIKLERNEWMIISILAVLKSGGAYVPIDVNYPQQRIDYIISDSNCKVVIDENEINSFKENRSNYSQNDLKCTITDSDLAYVIYTSGSTGNPKGVMVEHHSLVNLTTHMISYYNIQETDRVLQFASIVFDMSIEEIFPAISSGAGLIIRNNEMISSTETFFSAIDKWNISILNLPTAFWNQIVWDFKELDAIFPETVKIVAIGGEALNIEVMRTWFAMKKGAPTFINAYGPTEATVNASMFTISSDSVLDPNYSSIPIGSPVSNCNIYVLDQSLKLVPIGVCGEICISGVGISRGYLNNKSLNKEKFISNPHHENQRLYKTGDLGRWLPDGTIEYLGRKDDQIKIRGHRIELGEIESAISSKEELDSVVVLAKKYDSGEDYLVAYYNGIKKLDTSDLRLYIQNRLPSYMIPSYFVYVEELPLTINGKIDKKALPDPEELGLSNGTDYVAPKTEIEKKLISMWEDILEKEPIGINDNFFELGGHSLKAIRLLSRINKELNVDVNIKNIFMSPNVQNLASHISFVVSQRKLKSKSETLKEIEL